MVRSLTRNSLARGVAAALAAQYIRLIHLTGRWRVIGEEIPRRFWDTQRPFLVCFWHGRLLMMPYCRNPDAPPVYILISRHPDGRFIADTIKHFGVGAITGSTSRGGTSALRAVLKILASGATAGMLEWAISFEVGRLTVLMVMFFVLILLGMFMDPVSMMLITVPVFYPVMSLIGTEIIGLPVEQVLVWFSLIVLISLEMAGTTPPFGLLLFIMMGIVRGTSLLEVASYAAPFLLCDMILIILLVIFPAVGLFLPSLMGI